MILRVPSYYKEFRCIADKCEDSCCIGWEIDIDEDTFSYYKSVEGDFGRRLKEHMVSEDVNSFILRENGWCPFLNEKKLCDICSHLGEEALSEVCTEYPRFTIEYGNVREKALSLSCEEVGRIVFSSEEKMTFEEMELPDEFAVYEDWEEEDELVDEPADDLEDEPERKLADTETEEDFEETEYEEEEAYEVSWKFREKLTEVRDTAIEILQNRALPMQERIRQYLIYCAEAQEIRLNQEEIAIDRYDAFLRRMEAYDELEVLNDRWTNIKSALGTFFKDHDYTSALEAFLKANAEREYEYEHLMVYFTFRYFMKAWYDGNVLSKAQFAAASYLVIRDMDIMRYFENGKCYKLCDRIENVKDYAKEVEHSEENLEMLEDAFAFEEVFHIESMLAQI